MYKRLISMFLTVCMCFSLLTTGVLAEDVNETPDETPVQEETVPTPEPTAAAEPETTPEVTEEPEATEVPEVTETPEPTEVPEATESPEPTEVPEATETPEPTEEPEATEAPEATEEPEVTETPAPEVTEEPEATETPVPTPEVNEGVAEETDSFEAMYASVASGTCGENVTWVLDDKGTLTISGTGPMADYEYASDVPWAGYKTDITKVIVNSGVTTIGKRAFYGTWAIGFYENLTAVEIPDTVTKIGAEAFEYCDSLIEVSVPAAVTEIGYEAFWECSALTNISFDGDAPAIGSDAFHGVSAKAIYPADNATWTDAVKQNYGGTLYWVDSAGNGDYYYEGTGSDGISWVLENGVLTLSGTSNTNSGNPPWDKYRALIEKMVISEGITFVGSNWAYQCSNLTSVTIPSSVRYISYRAFGGCTSLKEITIPNGVRYIENDAFKNCTSLTEITIPGSVESIAGDAFSGCTALEQVTLPDKVTLGQYCFQNCTSLKQIKIPRRYYSYEDGFDHGSYVFAGCTALESVTFSGGFAGISNYMFSGCTALTSIELPVTISKIGASAFDGCSLTEITIPGGVSSIGANAFAGTKIASITFEGNPPTVASTAFSGLTAEVTYPGNLEAWTSVAGNAAYGGAAALTWVPKAGAALVASGDCGTNLTWTLDEDGVFTITGSGAMTDYTNNTPWRDYYAEQIKRIAFKGNITTIGDYAFTYCENLESVTIPDTVTRIGDYAFQRCTGLTELNLPKSGVTFGVYAFSGCTGLTELYIPARPDTYYGDSGYQSIYVVGYYVFENCTGLTGVELGEGTTHTGENTFSGCIKLKSVVLPSTMKSLGYNAFYNCKSLKEIAIPKGVTEIYGYAFSGCTDLANVIVPDGVTSVTNGSFVGCQSMTSITIPASVTTMEGGVFATWPYGEQPKSNIKTIKFNGRAPEFYDNTFTGVTATAYYPAKYESSWANAKKNYGGKITWVAYTNDSEGATTDNMTWELAADGTLTIRGGGAMTDYAAPAARAMSASPAPWLAQAEAITAVNLQGNINHIGTNAFAGCVNLKKITIPATMQSVGADAFAGCAALTTIHYAGSAEQWSHIQQDVGNEVLSSATRIEPAHVHRPVKATQAAIAATDNAPGTKTYTYYMCEGCGAWTNAKGAEMTEEAKAAFLSKYVTYVASKSAVIVDKDGNELPDALALNLADGTTVELGAMIAPAGSKPGAKWSSSSTKIAKVAADGVVTFLKPGTVTITLKSVDGKVKDTLKLTAAVWPAALTINAPEPELRSGKSMTLKAEFSPEDTTNKSVTWSLDSTAAATITAKGVLRAKTVYEETPVTVTAVSKADGSLVAEKEISILPKNDGVMAIYANGTGVTSTTQSCDVNAEIQLQAFTLGYGENVKWTVNKSGAAVDENGFLTFTKAGTYKITAKSDDGRSATVTYKVTVLAKAMSLKTTNGYTEVGSGKSLKLAAAVEPANTSNKGVTWKLIEGGEYAKISSAGVITANKGLDESHIVIAEATAKDGSGVSAQLTVTVSPVVTKVTMEQGSSYKMDMSSETALNLSATVEPWNAMTDIVWSANNSKVAAVDSEGNVIPLKPGTVTITAKAADGSGKSAKLKLTVIATMTQLQLTGGSTLAGGKKMTLKAEAEPAYTSNKAVTWSLEQGGDYASISSKGVLSAKKLTEAQIVTVLAVAKDGSGVEARHEVIIYPIATKVDVQDKDGLLLTGKTVKLAMGDTLILDAKVSPKESANELSWAAQDVMWSSSNTKVAAVSPDGEVTPVKPGTVTITAKAQDGSGKSGKMKVTVVQLMEELTIPASYDIAGGKSITFKPVVGPTNTTNKAVTWTLYQDGEYAALSTKGMLKTNKTTEVHTVTVAAEAVDGSGIVAKCEVTIYPEATAVNILNDDDAVLNGQKLTLTVGDTANLRAEVFPELALQDVTWSSSNKKLAAVDENGEVTALKKGTVTITAKAKDGSGKSAKIKVAVVN